MALAKKLTGVVQVGLLGLALLAGPAWTRTVVDQIPGFSLGIRGGGVLPSTDLTGVMSPHGAIFARYGIMRGLQGELSIGYTPFTTKDTLWTGSSGTPNPALTKQYKTDLSWVQLRAIYAPKQYERWNPYLYAGAGFEYFNVQNASLTPRRGAFNGIGHTLGIPLGIGARYKLASKVGLEAGGGYTLTFSDNIDEKDDGGKSDNRLEINVGLTYAITMGRTVERVIEERVPAQPPPPVAAPEKPSAPVVMPTADQDGDGLNDWEETRVYFTNPRMADSDGDGLSDKQEVQTYRTDPNKADSDGGGVNDGIEVQRGMLPLWPGDDARLQEREIPGLPQMDITLPVVTFPTGGATLSAADSKALDKVATALKQYPTALVEVRGFADNVGSSAQNLKLSVQRAQAVADYLSGKGLEAWRLGVVGVGEKDPVASNGTPEGRAKNRRVELLQVR